MLEDKIDALIAAINANTAAHNAAIGRAAPTPPAESDPLSPAPAKAPRASKAAKAEPDPSAPVVDINDVRDVLKSLPRERVAQLLKAFSPDGKMSGVPATRYAELMAEARACDANAGAGDDPLLG